MIYYDLRIQSNPLIIIDHHYYYIHIVIPLYIKSYVMVYILIYYDSIKDTK